MITYLGKGDATVLLEDVWELDSVHVIGPERAMHLTDACFYIVFDERATAGAVAIETAHERGYKGKWAVREIQKFKEPGRVHYVGVPGTHLAMRVRVIEPVQGGTVSVFGVGKN